MRTGLLRGGSAPLVLILLATSVPLSVRAQVAAAPADSVAAPPSVTTDASGTSAAPAPLADSSAAHAAALEGARELLRDGDYDRSIEVLKSALDLTGNDPARRRESYLLLIKTYVFLGNDLKFKPQGREASNLNYQEARRLIAECLGRRELRHTYPEPASQYPPEMIGFFAETRRSIFGSFRIQEIVPGTAVVLLDGDTLRVAPGETQPGEVNMALGEHVVVVRAAGFKETIDRITIAPDVTLERSYRLEKKKSGMWYATRGAGALGVVGGVIAAIAGRGGGGATTAAPLPGAPDPP